MKKTKAQRRVAVAKDALKQVKLNIYAATECITVGLSIELEDLSNAARLNLSDADARKTLLKMQEPCEVCARGALFLSTIRKENDFLLKDLHFVDGDRIDRKLDTLFSNSQYKLMEAYFEGWDKGYEFGQAFPDQPKKRLELILKNMIKNNGIFKPNQLKYATKV